MRLTKEQDLRLDRAARRDGKTKQAFVQDAVVRALEASEGRAAAEPPARPARAAPAPCQEPGGLGLTGRLGPARSSQEAAPVGVAQEPGVDLDVLQGPPPVVVNVGGPGGGGGGIDLVAGLAAYVAAGGPNYERAARSRQAEAVLMAAVPAEADRRAAFMRLEAAVDSILKTRPGVAARAAESVLRYLGIGSSAGGGQ